MKSRIPEMGPRTVESQVMEFSMEWLRLCELSNKPAAEVRCFLCLELHDIFVVHIEQSNRSHVRVTISFWLETLPRGAAVRALLK